VNDKYVFLDEKNKKELSDNEYGRLGKNISLMFKYGLPVLPAVIIKIEHALKLYKNNFMSELNPYLKKLTPHLKKELGDNKTAVINLVTSSSMAMVANLHIQNIGLHLHTIDVFLKHFGEDKTFTMLNQLVSDIFYFKNKFKKELTVKETTRKYLVEILDEQQEGALPEDDYAFLKNFYKLQTVAAIKKYLNDQKEKETVKNYFTDTLKQLESILRDISAYLDTNEELSSIILQPVIHGHFNKASYRGFLYTNDLISGELKINGRYVQEMAKYHEDKSKSLEHIEPELFERLSQLAQQVRYVFKDIMKFLFLIENKKIWLLDIYDVEECSFQADLNNKLDLFNNNKLDEKEIIRDISLEGVTQLLHPVVNQDKAEGVQKVNGGLVGAPGAASGKVYFSSAALLDAYEIAAKNNQPTDFILAMPHTFAEEVKAIKVGKGVISSFGGFASHAPVVCRSLNKVSVVEESIEWGDKQLTIFGNVIKEGDEVTINAEVGRKPEIYFGKVPLIEPDFRKNNLTALMDVVNRYNNKIKVFSNVDEPVEAKQALIFQAQGIGLCRTEHMFFAENRLIPFLEMILTRKKANQEKALRIIEGFQTEDFYSLFKVFGRKPVTIRLLDAPLHEFIPKESEKLEKLIEHMTRNFPDIDETLIKNRCALLKEFNPMLGNRGCRLGIMKPDIYRMQARAIINAACKLKKENNIDPLPKIMIPLVSMQMEMRFLKDGKVIEGETVTGIREVVEEVLDTNNLKDQINYQIGCMIELPSATLASDSLAHCADFFSYGTNDLTQTTYGLSRDDTTELINEYTKYDIMDANPFSALQRRVKELLMLSTRRAKVIRPDINLSLCGEHGADPANISFLIKNKIDIVSCSPFSIPLVKLAVAKEEINQ